MAGDPLNSSITRQRSLLSISKMKLFIHYQMLKFVKVVACRLISTYNRPVYFGFQPFRLYVYNPQADRFTLNL